MVTVGAAADTEELGAGVDSNLAALVVPGRPGTQCVLVPLRLRDAIPVLVCRVDRPRAPLPLIARPRPLRVITGRPGGLAAPPLPEAAAEGQKPKNGMDGIEPSAREAKQ